MTASSVIDLEKLPPPDIIETLDFETILNEMLDDLRERLPALDISLESDPTYKILEVAAYRELLLRSRINDASSAVMLAYAVGPDLDNIAAMFNLGRQIVLPGDNSAIPPAPPVYESDSRFRARIQLSLNGLSTAGPIGSYLFHALSADARVKDVDVSSPSPGRVVVTVLSAVGLGEPDDELLELVNARLNAEDVRPLTDFVTVQAPEIVIYSVEAELILFNGPDAEVVRRASLDAVQQYAEDRHRLGHDITLSGLYAALHQPGVQRVNLLTPNENIVVLPNAAPFSELFNVTIGSVDE